MIGDIPAAVIVFLAAGTLAFLLSRRGMTKKQLTLAIIALAVAILGIATWIPWIPAGFPVSLGATSKLAAHNWPLIGLPAELRRSPQGHGLFP
jgi:ammonia channel protein AmtB